MIGIIMIKYKSSQLVLQENSGNISKIISPLIVLLKIYILVITLKVSKHTLLNYLLNIVSVCTLITFGIILTWDEKAKLKKYKVQILEKYQILLNIIPLQYQT